MIRIHDVEQGTEAWHALRKDKYTGSNADKLLKFGAIEYSRTGESTFGGNFYTRRGHILEDEALELYEAIKRCTISRPGFITNDKYPDLGYSPDGVEGLVTEGVFLIDGVLHEVKAFTEEKHMKMFNGEIPFKVEAQIHFGLFVTELKLARLDIYNPDLEPTKALKTFEFRAKPAINANFKRKLAAGGLA